MPSPRLPVLPDRPWSHRFDHWYEGLGRLADVGIALVAGEPAQTVGQAVPLLRRNPGAPHLYVRTVDGFEAVVTFFSESAHRRFHATNGPRSITTSVQTPDERTALLHGTDWLGDPQARITPARDPWDREMTDWRGRAFADAMLARAAAPRATAPAAPSASPRPTVANRPWRTSVKSP